MGLFKSFSGTKPQTTAAKPADISKSLDSAVSFHRAGNLQEAERIYRQILAVAPDNPGANHLLGLIALQQGDADRAIQLISKAIENDPSRAHYYSNLGNALQENGRFEDAIGQYEKAISMRPDFAEAHNNLGNSLRETGRIDEAVSSFNRALALNPNYKEALSNLAVALQVQGKVDEAIDLINKALSIDPSLAEAHNSLGRALHEKDRIDEAVSSFNRAISLKPLYADPHINLGNLYKTQNKLEDAAAHYKKALDINPVLPETLNNLGNILQEQGKGAEAEACYRKAIGLKPDFAPAHYNLGNFLHQQDELEEAATCFRKAFEIEPEFALAYSHLGNNCVKLNKMAEAIEYYNKALAINPEIAETLSNLALIYSKKGKLVQAEEYLQKAVSIEPDNLGALNNLGNVLLSQGKLNKAVGCLQKALALKPDDADTLNNLGNALQSVGKLTEGRDSFKKAVLLKPDNPEAFNNLGNISHQMGKNAEAAQYYQKALALKPQYATAHSNYLLMLNYLPDLTDQEIYLESLKWEEQQAAGLMKNEFNKVDFATHTRPLKIGYVSPDFRNHSVAYFFEPLLKAHNRNKFRIYCYSNVPHPDNITERLQSEADQWTSIRGVDDKDGADIIRHDGIDILVDLSGHTGGNRLVVFAHKPAPIQVTWLGYPNTTGMKAIDYRFTDEITDPGGEADGFYSEKLIRLENGFLCYQPYEPAPEVAALPFNKEGFITFGSFNNFAKVNAGVIKLWAEILHAVPHSRLILKGSVGNQDIKKQFKEIFNKQGVLSKKVVFYDKLPKQEDHLALYSKIDIGLDPFPYNGTTTTCEALWMGVPVVTLLGGRHAGRVGASIMQRLGLDDLLVAETRDDYIKKAAALARQTDRLAELRGSLRSTMLQSPLCDAGTFAKTVEDAYTGIWEDYLKTR